jgi:hypothetical protein
MPFSVTYLALRRPLLQGRVLRSGDPAGDLTGDIGRAVLSRLHGPRRPRVCARKLKSPLSRWNKHPDGKPRTTRNITGITAHIDAAHHQPATRRRNL